MSWFGSWEQTVPNQDKGAFLMQQIGEIIQNRPPQPKTKIRHEWQDKAYNLHLNLKLPKTELPNLFRFFKTNYQTNPGLIDQATSYVSDYVGQVPKLKLFYWQFYKLKSGR